jgi:hypothetical protein
MVMGQAEDKIGLIKKIIAFHPAYEPGRKRGWSWYVGGMRDTGDWDFRKLMDATEAELNQCLQELEEIENTPARVLTDEEYKDQNTVVMVAPGIWSNMYQVKLMQKLMVERENAMLWGK